MSIERDIEGLKNVVTKSASNIGALTRTVTDLQARVDELEKGLAPLKSERDHRIEIERERGEY